MIAREPRCW